MVDLIKYIVNSFADKKEMVEIEETVSGKEVTVTVKTGKDGKFFGSVTNKEVAERFTELGYNIDKKKINIPAIKAIGTYPATVRISAEETAKITVIVKA